MIHHFEQRIGILRFIWQQYRWKTVQLAGVSILNIVAQISTIALLIPIIEYMKTNGDINVESGYWKYFQYVLSTMGQELTFLNIIIICFICICLYQLFNYLKQYHSQKLRYTFQEIFRKLITKSILLGNYQGIIKHPQSSLQNMVLQQSEQATIFIFTLIEYLQTLLQVIIFLAFLCVLSLKLSLIVGSFVLLQLSFSTIKSRFSKKLGTTIKEQGDLLSQYFFEYSTGIKFLTILGHQKKAYHHLKSILDKIVHSQIKVAKKQVQLETSQETVYIAFILSIIFAAFQIWQISFTTILIFLFTLTRLVPILRAFNKHNVTLNNLYPFFQKLRHFVEETPTIQNPQKVTLTGPIDQILLENVSFSYTHNKPILENISQTFKPNTLYAVLGESGAGKTTLLDVLLGLLEPQSGKVSIHSNASSYEIKDVELKAFYLPQVPIVLSGTLRKNLLRFTNHTQVADQQLIQALTHVNLWNHFSQDKGLDSIIHERGHNLSEGQKQRLCLSQVFIQNFSLIVLDEFTSAVDEDSKQIILTAIKNIRNSIIVFITHDKTTADIADEVIHLKPYSTVSLTQ